MPKWMTMYVSATELPQFGRLVEFVTEVSVHADAYEDDDLREMVAQCRADLLAMMEDSDA